MGTVFSSALPVPPRGAAWRGHLRVSLLVLTIVAHSNTSVIALLGCKRKSDV